MELMVILNMLVGVICAQLAMSITPKAYLYIPLTIVLCLGYSITMMMFGW